MNPNDHEENGTRVVSEGRRDLAQSMGQHLTDDRYDPDLSHGVDEQPTGMAKKYLVLSEEERAKGFVRPLRRSYIHEVSLGGCGVETKMGLALCETYAANPSFYGATFCAGCQKHRPVGPNGEFTWSEDGELVGT